MKMRLRRPSPAMIVAVIALIAALGGTSVAAFKIHSKNIARNAVGNKQNANWKAGPVKRSSAAASQALAPKIGLASRGPLHVYGKCFESGPDEVTAQIYVRSSKPGALLQSDDDNLTGDGAEPNDGYLNPGDDENYAEVEEAVTDVAPSADSESHSYFHAIRGKTALDGLGMVFAKNGSLPAGDGPYGGSGDRCIFQVVVGAVG